MSDGNWRPSPALTRGLIAALCAASLFAYLAKRGVERCMDTNKEPGYAATIEKPTYYTPIPGRATVNLPRSVYKNLDCDKPQGEKEYELCQQWRAAEGAAQQACIAGLQFWIGGFIGMLGLGGLLGTVWYAAGSAKSAAQAAHEMAISNRHQREATQTELRPYVFHEDLQWAPRPRGKDSPVAQWLFEFAWKNCGQTPALNVRALLNVDTFETGQGPEQINFADIGGKRDAEASSLGPGQDFVSRATVPLDKVVEQWNQRRVLYCWGWVEYDDSFPGSDRHRTEVCCDIRALGDPSKRDAKFEDGFTSRFNGADNDCVHKPKRKKAHKK